MQKLSGPISWKTIATFLSLCFTSTETARLIRDRERGVCGGALMSSAFARSDPQRPKRPSATVRTTNVKEVGTPSVRSSLCTSLIAVSTAVRNKVAKTWSVRKAAVENNSAARHSIQLRKPSSTSLLLISPGLRIHSYGWRVLYVHRNRRLIRDGSPERPPDFHTFWTAM